MNFFATRNFLKHWRVPLRSFSLLWDKKFSTENRESPLFLSLTFFDTRNNEALRGSPTKIFGSVRPNFSTENRESPLFLSLTFFDTRNNEALKDSPTKFSTLRDKKLSTENLDTPPALIHKLFQYLTFSETQVRRVPLRNFSALWDKKFSTQNRDKNSLKHKIFRYPKLVTD